MHRLIVDTFLDRVISKHAAGRSYSAYLIRHHKNIMDRLGFGFWTDWYLPILPFFITQDHRSAIERDIATILKIILAIPKEKFHGDLVRYSAFLGLTAGLHEIAKLQFGRPWRLNIARPDCYITSESVKIVDVNLDSGIGGIADCHLFIEYYRNNPLIKHLAKALQKRFSFEDALTNLACFLDRLPKPLWYLESTLHDDDLDGHLRAEREYISTNVDNVLFARPADVTHSQDSFYLKNRRVGAVFRGFSPYQFEKRVDEFSHLMRGMGETNVTPWESSSVSLLFENKINLAIISDNDQSPWLTSEQRSAVERCIPWTRVLHENQFAMLSQDHRKFVLKKAASHRGKGVVIGRESSQDKMIQAARAALQEGGWILQKYVEPPLWKNIFWVEQNFERVSVPFIARIFMIDGLLQGLSSNISPHLPAAETFTPGFRILGGGGLAIVSQDSLFSVPRRAKD